MSTLQDRLRTHHTLNGARPKPVRPERTRSRLASVGPPLLSLVIVIAVWWASTIVFHIRTFFLPAPPDIVESFLKLPDYLLKEAWVTLSETLMGFSIAAVGGMAIAVLFSASELVQRATLPLLVAVNSIPEAGARAAAAALAGLRSVHRVVMVVLICFFPIVVAGMAGPHLDPGRRQRVGEVAVRQPAGSTSSSSASRGRCRQIFVGLKVAISLAIVGAGRWPSSRARVTAWAS
jgi:NitT/TauT family transport system permease protein